MDERKVFCEECRNDVNFCIYEEQMEGSIKGEKYSYLGKKAYCVDCGEEVYVAELNDYNLKVMYDAYRMKNGIVSLETILAIPKKYAIGKRPLSILLGWGEQTFSRYCEGDMPTKQYSDILQKIYDEPHFYADILEINKKNLRTIVSYEKSKKTVDAILGNVKTKKSKIELVIEYILSYEEITPLALQKVLYYIQGFYYAFNNTFLFSEDCEAWVHGPVYRDVYFRYCNYYSVPIDGIKEIDCSAFSAAEKALLDSVISYICCYSGKVLEKFTHAEKPWLYTRGELPEDAASNRIIEKKLIGDYFNEVKVKYNMVNPRDIKGYTKRMFEQI